MSLHPNLDALGVSSFSWYGSGTSNFHVSEILKDLFAVKNQGFEQFLGVDSQHLVFAINL